LNRTDIHPKLIPVSFLFNLDGIQSAWKEGHVMKAERNLLHIEELAARMSDRLLQYREDPNGILMSLLQSGLGLSSILSGTLHVPRHIFIAKDLRAPCPCPCSIGALTETNFVYMEESVIARQQWPYRELRAQIEKQMQEQRGEIARLKKIHRSPHGLPELAGRHVLFVNDGTASSAALIASIESFRLLGAGRIVLAVPSDFRRIASDIEQRVDELVIASPSLDHPRVA
jgi:predicted phosphoribosyltransferase